MSATAASLEALLASGEDSDVTVYVEGKAFYLHSWLLRLRSPFFKGKLSGNWNAWLFISPQWEGRQFRLSRVRSRLYRRQLCKWKLFFQIFNILRDPYELPCSLVNGFTIAFSLVIFGDWIPHCFIPPPKKEIPLFAPLQTQFSAQMSIDWRPAGENKGMFQKRACLVFSRLNRKNCFQRASYKVSYEWE